MVNFTKFSFVTAPLSNPTIIQSLTEQSNVSQLYYALDN